jgi:hypothetical protein
MFKYLRLLPDVRELLTETLKELKAIHSNLNTIRMVQIEIKEEVQIIVSEIGAIQSTLDTSVVPDLDNISNNSDNVERPRARSVPYDEPP